MAEPHKDVRDITASIMAIQAADIAADKADKDIDTSYIHRGPGIGMDSTYLKMAKGLGMGENKYPESNVKDLCTRAKVRFIRNFIFLLISKAARRHGFSEDDSIDFAAQSYRMEKQIGRSDTQILERWL